MKILIHVLTNEELQYRNIFIYFINIKFKITINFVIIDILDNLNHHLRCCNINDFRRRFKLQL